MQIIIPKSGWGGVDNDQTSISAEVPATFIPLGSPVDYISYLADVLADGISHNGYLSVYRSENISAGNRSVDIA